MEKWMANHFGGEGLWQLMAEMDTGVRCDTLRASQCTQERIRLWCVADNEAWLCHWIAANKEQQLRQDSYHLKMAFDRDDNFLRSTYRILKDHEMPAVKNVTVTKKCNAKLCRSSHGRLVVKITQGSIDLHSSLPKSLAENEHKDSRKKFRDELHEPTSGKL